MAVPASIQPLVDKYSFHREAYIRGQEKYNETQLRQDFTDPFFHALGWDVNNNKGHSEAYREVLHEEPVRIRGTTYFFDYTFRIGGVRKFIVETKKPSVRIKDDADAALQLRWYAWNAKLPLSILTNFEEWAIYDCTIKPGNGDNAAKGRIEYFTYKEIPEKWGYLVSVFSQECILKGSFDKYAATTKGKKGTATVDNDILTEIESWRDALAKNIALRNTDLSVEELNTIVQRTIDRLLFLRICEDRGIEEYMTLQKLLEGDHVYSRLCDLFRLADTKYNSGLFHFEKEQDRSELPDTISLAVTIDDKVLKGIIKRLYYPETPYLFSVIPPAILGHVYEQFLGKVIRLTENHQAKVEYKPEVKKAGGVFYTPEYIVEYIVKHTVGELLKDKPPREWSKLRILDPACGSGSFLIGAYQFLLDRHRDWYIEHLVPVFIDKKSVTDPAVLALLPEPSPRGKKKLAAVELPIYKAGSSGDATRTRSDWRLTTAEKKRILLNNIFGVDIDTQAVETTKLSLLLKVLEEENEENIDKQLKLFAERALPSLHENIKCGNSLIGWDIVTPDMPADEVKRINPFDWDREFADVMKAGGFDAVIGNPPYGVPFTDYDLKYLQKMYSEAKKCPDSYCIFMIKGVQLSKKNGSTSFIVPNTFCDLETCEDFRKWLLNSIIFSEIMQTGWAFKAAVVDTMVYIFKKSPPVSKYQIPITIDNVHFLRDCNSFRLNEKNKIDYRNSDGVRHLIAQIFSKTQKLKEIAVVKAGLILYEKGKGTPAQTEETMISKPFTIKGESCPDGWRPLNRGGDISRYFLSKTSEFVKYGPWLAAQRDPEIFLSPKIIIRRTDDKLRACLEENSSVCVKSCHILHFKQNLQYSYNFLLGLLNSRLLQRVFELQNPQMIGKVFAEIKLVYVENLPIRTINFADPADVARHDRMVSLVTQMLDLNKKVQDAKLDHEKTLLQRQIEATDAAIDKLVYELYGLTEEEIGIVEGKTK